VDVKESTTHAANLVVFFRPPLPSTFRVFVCLPLFGCLQSSCVWSYPLPPTINVYSTFVLPTPFFTPPPSYSLNPISLNPLLPNPLCSLHPTPRHHPCYCYPPTMSHSKPNSSLTPIITPTLIPRSPTHQFGAVEDRDQSGRARRVCYMRCLRVPIQHMRRSSLGCPQHPPPGQQLRARPDFPVPADLQANARPAARDTFKRATDARIAWLACSAAFCVAILDSIGESNRLAISDPDTDTLHLSPRDIINAMTALHGALTGVEVDALRLPLKEKLSALTDLPAHIVTFRGHLVRLTTAGQAPLALDAYRLFLASLSSFPVFHQYTLLWTVANGAIAQQTFERYATYIGGQHSNILAHSTLRPFAGNVEAYHAMSNFCITFLSLLCLASFVHATFLEGKKSPFRKRLQAGSSYSPLTVVFSYFFSTVVWGALSLLQLHTFF
jgi:hypothetical protein